MKKNHQILPKIMGGVANIGVWICALGIFDGLVWILKIFFEHGHYY